MTLQKYIDQLPSVPSDAKLKILKALWGNGKRFPGPWVGSSKLLAITGQKYFDRRIRELRDEIGCDIETGHSGGRAAYRLVSLNLGRGNRRAYMTTAEKKELFNRQRYKCQICGKAIDAGVRGLQADHKVPLIRGGTHEQSNWQAICNECNVAKRRACAGCELNCLECPWAYPENTGIKTIIRLSPSTLERLKKLADDNETSLERTIEKILKLHVDM